MRKSLFILSCLFISCLSCTSESNSTIFSEQELIEIRDGFDKRVADSFDAERGKELIKAKIDPPIKPHRPEFCQAYSWSIASFAASCFWFKEKIDVANAALIENAEYYLEDPLRIYDRDNFHWHAETWLRYVDLFGTNGTKNKGLLSKEAEDKILEVAWLYAKRNALTVNDPPFAESGSFDTWSEFDKTRNAECVSFADHKESDTWYIYESENHHSQDFTARWHFAKIAKDRDGFKNRIYDDGYTAIEHYDNWNDYLKMYFAERAKKGMFIEMMSMTYNTDLLKGIFNIYDFAEDKEVKRRAGLLLDLYFAHWGQEQMNGITGGGKSRIYSDWKAEYSGYGYYFFGLGESPGIDGKLISAMFTSYRPPLVVIDIVVDRIGKGVYEVYQRPLGLAATEVYFTPPVYRMRTDFGGVLRYSYCTPDFIVGTPMIESRPLEDWVLINSQNRSHGVIFNSDGYSCILPQCEKTNGLHFNSEWSVQRKGTLITQKLKTNLDAGAKITWFSEEGLSIPTIEDDWVFTESEGAYAALKAVKGGIYWSDKKETVPGKWLYCEDEYTPVILEVAQKSDFKSFEEFKKKLKSLKIIFENEILNYTGIYGDTFTFYADYSHAPEINGATVNYAPTKAFNSPFLYSEWNSGVIHIQKGERKLVLDMGSQN